MIFHFNSFFFSIITPCLLVSLVFLWHFAHIMNYNVDIFSVKWDETQNTRMIHQKKEKLNLFSLLIVYKIKLFFPENTHTIFHKQQKTTPENNNKKKLLFDLQKSRKIKWENENINTK